MPFRPETFAGPGTPDEAEHALRCLIDLSPDDASAHHNLGTLLLRAKRYDQAAESYRLAVRHRPDNSATYLHLGYALKGQGRITEADAAWKEVLRLCRTIPWRVRNWRGSGGNRGDDVPGNSGQCPPTRSAVS